jgi:Ca2+-binding RTX toxin-like protein
VGGRGDDRLWGGRGEDELEGGLGIDESFGEGGPDHFYMRADGDTVTGGAPEAGDEVAYIPPDSGPYLGSPVTVDLREGVGGFTGSPVVDHFSGVSEAWGTSFADVLLGDDGPNSLAGDLGNDLLDGRGGEDYLAGHTGTDTCLNGESFEECELFTFRATTKS